MFTIIIFFPGCQPEWEIQNPYQDVDWIKHKQYKANLHTHTSISDGSMSPQAVIDLYQKHGYKILSLTDHNNVTYPWEKLSDMEPSRLSRIRNEFGLSGIKPENPSYESRGITPDALIFENRSPETLGMLAVIGNEITLNKSHISRGRHDMGSYFNDYSDTISTDEETLITIAEKNGLAIFMHPGRYDFSLQWYLDFYKRFDPLIGMELFNGGETRCLEIWDSLLINLMPGKPVWGFSNDDLHRIHGFGRNWNVFILPELNEELVRYGMKHGLTYFVYAPDGHDGPLPPSINAIEVNSRKGEIQIHGEKQDSVIWISSGKIVCKGDLVELNKHPEINGYIRAVLYGAGGKTIVGTQPFGIRKLKR